MKPLAYAGGFYLGSLIRLRSRMWSVLTLTFRQRTITILNI